MADEWWKVLWREEHKDWTYALLTPEQVAQPDASWQTIEPNAGYINVLLRSMRVPYSRKGWTAYCPAVHCFTQLKHSQDGTLDLHSLATPVKLKELDPKNVSRIEMGEARLLGPIPYRGGDVSIELGLFSVATANFAAPYLALIDRVASIAGGAYVQAAAPIAGAVKEGLDILFGREDDVSLETGLVNSFSTLRTGYYVLARAPKGTLPTESLKVDEAGRLFASGQPVTVPYVVFSITASTRRDDYFDIPEVRVAYDAIRSALGAGDAARARDAFQAFRIRTLMCSDLLMADAQRIVALTEEQMKAILSPASGAGLLAAPAHAFPALADLPVYAGRDPESFGKVVDATRPVEPFVESIPIDVTHPKALLAAEPPLNRDPANLVAAFWEKLRAALAELEAGGTPFFFHEGFRTKDRQQWLYGQGRPNVTPYGRAGNIVTQRDGVHSLSNHQGNGTPGSGRAADCYPLKNGKIYIPAGNDPVWKKYADAVEKQGLVAGLNWASFKDAPHCELPA